MTDCIFNCSGGKDSALALYYCLQDPELNIRYLVTTVNDAADRISMHGVRTELLIKQAESIGIPLYQIRLPEMPDMATYDTVMSTHLTHFKNEGITHSIFGDIFLEDLRDYRDKRLAEVGNFWKFSDAAWAMDWRFGRMSGHFVVQTTHLQKN